MTLMFMGKKKQSLIGLSSFSICCFTQSVAFFQLCSYFCKWIIWVNICKLQKQWQEQSWATFLGTFMMHTGIINFVDSAQLCHKLLQRWSQPITALMGALTMTLGSVSLFSNKFMSVLERKLNLIFVQLHNLTIKKTACSSQRDGHGFHTHARGMDTDRFTWQTTWEFAIFCGKKKKRILPQAHLKLQE